MRSPPARLVEETEEPITSFVIRVADDPAEFAELWPRTDCRGPAHCYVFQCADYLKVWRDTIGKARGTRALFVAVFDDIRRPMLLLPLGIERQRGLRVLRFLDGGVCDYNAPIVFEPTRAWGGEALELLWRKLLPALPPFDIAMFDKMPADICGKPNPLIDLRGAPFPESGHLTRITGSWEQYVANQMPYRRKSGQQRRKLARIGPVMFKVAETSADRQRVVQTMMRQKSRRCIETGEADELALPGYKQYYITMTERFAWPGPLHVAALEVGDKIVSTSWSLIFDRRFLWLVTTFEGNEWKRFSPGRLLLEDLLKWGFSNGINIFDCGIGDESYKLGYSDQELLLYHAHIPITMLGKVCQSAWNTRLWGWLLPVLKRAVRKIGLTGLLARTS
jgi:CelD/BcsL family acetyltransferase involved in cellulose biosynthesis